MDGDPAVPELGDAGGETGLQEDEYFLLASQRESLLHSSGIWIVLMQCYSDCGPRSGDISDSITWELVKIQTPRPYPRFTESTSLGAGPWNLCYSKPSWECSYRL